MYRVNATMNLNVNSRSIGCYRVSIYRDDSVTEEATYRNGDVYNNVRGDSAFRKSLSDALNYALDYIGIPCEICLKFVCGETNGAFLRGLGDKTKCSEVESVVVIARLTPKGRWIASGMDEYF